MKDSMHATWCSHLLDESDVMDSESKHQPNKIGQKLLEHQQSSTC